MASHSESGLTRLSKEDYESIMEEIDALRDASILDAPDWLAPSLDERVHYVVEPKLKTLESSLEKKFESLLIEKLRLHKEECDSKTEGALGDFDLKLKKLESSLDKKVDSTILTEKLRLHKEVCDAKMAKIDESRGDFDKQVRKMRDELLRSAPNEDPIKARDETIKVLEAQVKDRDEKIKVLEAQISVLERALHGNEEEGVRCESKENLASL